MKICKTACIRANGFGIAWECIMPLPRNKNQQKHEIGRLALSAMESLFMSPTDVIVGYFSRLEGGRTVATCFITVNLKYYVSDCKHYCCQGKMKSSRLLSAITGDISVNISAATLYQLRQARLPSRCVEYVSSCIIQKDHLEYRQHDLLRRRIGVSISDASMRIVRVI